MRRLLLQDGTIFVTSKKGTANVTSLKKTEPDLDKHTKVVDAWNRTVLCDDIADGSFKTIFRGRF